MPNEHSLIVGGSSGIGLATATRLAEAGHRITITGRDQKKLARAAGGLGAAAQGVPLDGRDTKALPAVFERVGAIDHLVLCISSHKGLGAFRATGL